MKTNKVEVKLKSKLKQAVVITAGSLALLTSVAWGQQTQQQIHRELSCHNEYEIIASELAVQLEPQLTQYYELAQRTLQGIMSHTAGVSQTQLASHVVVTQQIRQACPQGTRARFIRSESLMSFMGNSFFGNAISNDITIACINTHNHRRQLVVQWHQGFGKAPRVFHSSLAITVPTGIYRLNNQNVTISNYNVIVNPPSIIANHIANSTGLFSRNLSDEAFRSTRINGHRASTYINNILQARHPECFRRSTSVDDGNGGGGGGGINGPANGGIRGPVGDGNGGGGSGGGTELPPNTLATPSIETARDPDNS